MTMCFPHLGCRRKGAAWIWAVALMFWLGASGSVILAEGTNAAPSQPSPPSAAVGDFSQFLADHQEELSPFFSKHTDEFFKEAFPVLFGLAGWILVIILLVGWVIDVLMGRGFSGYFAPAFAKITRAVTFATGRLVLGAVMNVGMGLAIFLCSGFSSAVTFAFLIIAFFMLVSLVVQIWWVLYIYRANLAISALFYVAVVLAHMMAGVMIAGPIISARVNSLATNFIDQNVVRKLQVDVTSAKQDLATATAARDAAKAKVDDAQNQITQAQAEQEKIRQEIEDKKKSEGYLFRQIVQMDAQGDLNSARDQLTDLIRKFPSGMLIEQAKARLAQVNADLADQEARRKQAEADAARARAQARAELLARAAKGQATLSDMRLALIGKNQADVVDLLGQPIETASDRWGYARKMIVDPLTNEKFGLTIVFFEGLVQGVDYYYGKGDSQ